MTTDTGLGGYLEKPLQTLVFSMFGVTLTYLGEVIFYETMSYIIQHSTTAYP
jgi:hypothetical protein